MAELQGALVAIFGDDPPADATKGARTIHAVMMDAERRMREALAQHTIASLAARPLRKLPAEYRPQTVHCLMNALAAGAAAGSRLLDGGRSSYLDCLEALRALLVLHKE